MLKIIQFLNRFFWKHFDFRISIQRKASHANKEPHRRIVWAFTAFDSAYRCWLIEGKFHSLNDGSPIKGVRRYSIN